MDHSNLLHLITTKYRSLSSKKLPLITHITITLCLVFNPSHLALAQDIEEVTIQAEQQTGEMLDDLVSVAALSGEKLADAGIENVEDVAAYVPNLVLTETETGTNIFIRGIGAGVNQGFDQSVGLYSDGVPLPRANMSRAPFLDLSNVQVLRGPQYVLDGNYSIAGSVHMQTNLSTDEFSAGVDINYVPSQNDQTVLLTVGGPINDQFSARIAIQSKRSDGYMENVTLDQDGPAKDELLGRFVFGWNPTEDLSFKLKAERGSFDTRGRASEIILDMPSPDLSNIVATHPFVGEITRWAPDATRTQLAQPWVVPSIDWIHYPLRTNFDAARVTSQNSDDLSINPGLGFYWANKSFTQKLAELYTEHGFAASTPIGLQDTELNYKRASDIDEFSENSIVNYTLNSEYWLGEHKLTATSSYIEYEFDELIDGDSTAAPLVSSLQDEQYSQIFQSFGYQSPEGLRVELRAGASYLKSSLKFHDRTNLLLDDLPYATNGAVPQADRTFSVETPLRGYLGGWKAGSAAIISFQTVMPDREFEQDTETFAIYLQPTINWTETFKTVVGLRYTRSEKEALRDLAFVTPDGIPLSELAAFNPDPATATPLELGRAISLRNVIFQNYINFFGIQAHTDRFNSVETFKADGTSILTHNVTGEIVDPNNNSIGAIRGTRTEDQLLPSITFEWNVSDDFTLTLSARKANKLGGFDARSNTTPRVKPLQGAPAGTFEFEDEDATTYEIGSLWYLPNGWGELRSTFFYSEFTNLQLSRFDGRSGFNVDNAGGATSMGVEVEGLLSVSDAFSINYSLAWMDFEFDKFLKGACHLGRAPDHFFVPFDVPVQQTDILRQAHPTYAWNDVNNNGVIDKGDFIPIEYNVPRPPPVTKSPFAAGAAIDKELNHFDDVQLGAPSFCDFKGQTNQFVAEWQGTFSFNYEIGLIGVGMLKPTLDVIYNSGYHTSATQDPLVAQDAFVLLNGRLALASFEDVWEIALTGQNLTNQKIVSYSNDTPIGSRIQGARGFVGFVRPPRSIGLNLRYNFY